MKEKEQEKRLSMRGNLQIITLFKEINSHIPALTRTKIFSQACDIFLINKDDIDYDIVGKPVKILENLDTPEFIQLSINVDKYKQICDILTAHFNVKRIVHSFLVKTILQNYLLLLENVSDNESNANESNAISLEDKLKLNQKIAALLLDNSEKSTDKLLQIIQIIDEDERG